MVVPEAASGTGKDPVSKFTVHFQWVSVSPYHVVGLPGLSGQCLSIDPHGEELTALG